MPPRLPSPLLSRSSSRNEAALSNQWGTNSGVSSLIDLPGASAKFEVSINRYSVRVNGSTRQRRGRGGGIYRTIRWLFSSGSGWAKGKFIDGGGPMPSEWKGQTGTIIIQVAAGKTISYPVMVTEAGSDFGEKGETTPNVYIAWDLIGPPVYTGFGTLPAATNPSKSDQEQYEGTSKTVDPSHLGNNAVRRIDIWADLADTEAAEEAKLLAVIASALPPMTGLKLRSSRFERDSIDGGTIIEIWGLTDTAEDVINGTETVVVDPGDLNDREVTVAFNDTPALPGNAALKTRQTITREYNDSMVLSVAQHARTTSDEDVINAAQSVTVDPSGLADREVTAAWNGTPPAPTDSTLVERGTTTREYNDDMVLSVAVNGRRSIEDDITMPGTSVTTDAENLQSAAHETQVFETAGTEPDENDLTIDVPSGLKVVATTIRELDRVHAAKFFQLDYRSSAEKLIAAQTRTLVDPNDLEDADYTGELWDTGGSAPATPSVPRIAVKLMAYRDVPTSNPARTLRLYAWGKMDSIDRREIASTWEYADPSGISSRASAAAVDGTPSLPSGYTSRGARTQNITASDTGDHTLTVVQGGLLSTQEEIEHRGTSSAFDASIPASSTLIPLQTVVSTCLSTDDVAELAAAAQTTYRNTAGFDRLTVAKINKLRAQLRIYRVNDDKYLLESGGTSRIERLRTDATGAFCKVGDVRARATGVNEVILGVFGIEVAYGGIVLRRRLTGIENLSDIRFLAVRGYVNDDTFLGYGANTLLFRGVRFKGNWNLEGTARTQWYDLLFSYRSIGWFDDGVVPVGRWIPTAADVVPGETPSLTEIRSGWSVSAAPQADFSGFLA
jgi:hypothetical protein